MDSTSSASRHKASALYASSQFLAGRIMLSGMIAVAADVSGSRHWPLIWFLAMVVCVLSQTVVATFMRNAGWSGAAAFGLRTALSFFDTAMYSLAAAVISHNSGSASAPFGVTIIMMTMLYVLMHFYMQPRLVLFLNAPCFLGLMYCLGGNLLNESAVNHLAGIYMPLSGALFTIYFFVQARAHLAKARRALTKSRSEALTRAADAQVASQVKSEFLATMSHEIRTPLNGVLGIAQVMSVDELSDRQRERLTIIQTSGESLLAILNDLLDISKIEAGKLELESIDFALGDVAEGVHAMFNAAASAKNIAFRFSVEDSAQGSYVGDPARLRQLFYNLVSNAVKFTQEGEVSVSVTYADDQLRLQVRDTGIGIPRDRQAALFEAFVQADASTTRKYGGTGLGLAISNRLVQAMNGGLSFQSTEGVGSTFVASIPMTKRSAAAPVKADTRPTISREAESMDEGLRVLVAEDNPTNQVVIRLMLNQISIEPSMVPNGRAAVEASATQDWDVILMDIQMPEMDGVAAAREIRRRESCEGSRRTPILALTANAMTHQAAEYRAAGIDGVVPKPIAVGDLFLAMEAVVNTVGHPTESEAQAA